MCSHSGTVPGLPSPLAQILISGLQTGVKEEQIDAPSGSCLALAVCGTHDGFYREKRPKHKMFEVSKLRKSQKWETSVGFSPQPVDLDVILSWYFILHCKYHIFLFLRSFVYFL